MADNITQNPKIYQDQFKIRERLHYACDLIPLVPDDRDCRFELAQLLALRASALCNEGRYDEADPLFHEAIQIQEDLRLLDPDLLEMRSALLKLLRSQIQSLLERRLFAEASVLLKKYVDYQRREQDYSSGDVRQHEFLTGYLYAYASCLLELGQDKEARHIYAECLEAAESVRFEQLSRG